MTFNGGSNFITANNGECFLRLKLADGGTTMIGIPSKSITLWDLICKVAERKQFVAGDYTIIAEKNGKKTTPDLSCSLENYLDYSLQLSKLNDTNDPATKTGASRRRGSVMNAPSSKKMNFRMKKYNFPATIDEEQLKKRQMSSSGEMSLKYGKSKKSFSLFMFRRSSSNLMEARLSNGSLQDSENIEESINSNISNLSNLSNLSNNENHETFDVGSINSINSNESVQSHDISNKLKELTIPDFDSQKNDDTASINHTLRKTIVSAGAVVNGSSTLRRNTFRKHQRSQTDNLYLNGTHENNNIGLITIILLNDEKKEISFPLEISMEAILSTTCSRNDLNEEEVTFQSINGEKIQLDRLLGYYTVENNINSFKIVNGEKHYSTVCVSEEDQDVMILQYINNDDLQVMAGTIDKLIERATDDSEKDNSFLEIFLLTYRAYVKPLEFFQLLSNRFNCELPPNPTEDDITYFEDMKGLIQEKVVNVMEYWVDNHWHDFAVNLTLEEKLIDFINYLKPYDEYIETVTRIEEKIKIQKKKYEEMFDNIKKVEKRGKVMQSMLDQLDPFEVGQQLCLYDFKLMKNIHPIEYLNQIWGNKEDEESPCLDFFISRFNLESYWAATEVLKVKDLKKRIDILKRIINVTKACCDNNNFFSTFALLSGLSSNSIQRLKKTWDGLSSKTKAVYTEMEKLLDPSRNMRNYRNELKIKEPPIIPFLPIYLKDLTFINDGNQSKIENMINFDKLRMMSNRVHDITHLVNKSYSFKEDPIIQNYLAKPPKVDDEKELKQMSLECEKPDK